MSIFDVLINLSRVAAIFQAWESRINRMGFGGLPQRERISRLLNMLTAMATDPRIDEIIEEKYDPNKLP